MPSSHAERLEVIAREVPSIEAEYRGLQGWCRSARYDCERYSEAKLKLARSQVDAIKAELAKIS